MLYLALGIGQAMVTGFDSIAEARRSRKDAMCSLEGSEIGVDSRLRLCLKLLQ